MLREGRLLQSQLHELFDVVIGKVPKRQRDDEITLHVNLALNLSEPAIGSLFYRLAKEKGIVISTSVRWVRDPAFSK